MTLHGYRSGVCWTFVLDNQWHPLFCIPAYQRDIFWTFGIIYFGIVHVCMPAYTIDEPKPEI